MDPEAVAARAADSFRPDFNFEFLIFFIISGALSIFFLLYFNRLFASIVSYGIRTWTWHRYRVYIDISALQISLLAGRIFFTGLRYHGSNETFLVQHGYITWRYWLRRVREVDIDASRIPGEQPAGGKETNADLPCRINVDLLGLEWFVYNRSPAYDSILAGLTETEPPEARSSGVSDEKQDARIRPRNPQQNESIPSPRQGGRGLDGLDEQGGSGYPTSPSAGRSNTGFNSADGEQSDNDSPELPFFLKLLPIHINCQKAAAVIGNDNSKAILIVKADSVAGDVDASETKTSDPYRQVFKVQFKHPVIEMRDNDDFREDQVSRAAREKGNAQDRSPPSKASFFRHQRRKVVGTLRDLVPYWRRSVESFSSDSRALPSHIMNQIPGSNRWQGLSRYLDDRDQGDKARWTSVEYAAESTILDSPKASLTVYWDVVAKVTEQAVRARTHGTSTNINGSDPPAWGMHLSVNGGTMNYGPWADRQRADLQRVFFPTLSKDATAAKPPWVGDWRAPTQFQFLLDFDDTVTLRVPIREESKNWRYRGKEPQMNHQTAPNRRKQRNRGKKTNQGDASQLRPAGWLEFKVPSNSTVAYSMDMLASTTGYKNRLDLDLPSTELWSSVNHDVLWRSGHQRISCDLSNPLPWNTLRNWHFNVVSNDMKLYLLRDHIFLLIDLVDDWSSGPPSEYLVFTPFKYHLHLDLRNVQLFFNVNDENIIDKATALEDNAFLILSSPCLKMETCIPLDSYRPSKNAISFDVRADSWDLSFNAPQWNTQSAFLTSNVLGHAEALAVSGSYMYNATSSPANTDTLVLDVHSQSPYVNLYGFVIRLCILLKDNYFGDHVHFRTLDEHQEQLNLRDQNPEAEATAKPPTKISNDLDVIVSLKVDDPRIMLPTNLYSASQYVQCELASLAVDLRFTNYYMDMELELSPMNLSLGGAEDELNSPDLTSSDTELFIDGVRVFGHRLFGLPPSEPTYLCNYDVSVGAVKGACTPDFLSALSRGGAAFGFQFDDVENALVPYSSLTFYDVTFVRVSVHSIHLWLHVDEAAFLISTDTIEVKSNDWARSHYSKRANIHIPNLQLSCVNADSAAMQKARHQHPIETEAYFRTDIHIATIGRKYHFSEARMLQQELVRREDQRTHRTQFLLMQEFLGEFAPEPVNPPAQPSPMPPEPLIKDNFDMASSRGTTASIRPQRLKRQSSFLSLSSSSEGSVRRQRSPHWARNRSRQTDRLSTGSTNVGPGRHTLGPRDASASTGSRSAFHSTADYQYRDGHSHSSVAFSSQYVAPHFPLEGVQLDTKEAVFPSIEEENQDDIFNKTAAALEDIDPDHLSEEHAYSSTLLEFPSGITAFVTPEAIRHATALIAALQPSNPDDLLDSLQIGSMTEIFDFKKQQMVHGEIKDLLVRLPKANIRFLNSSSLDSAGPSEEEQDQYDLEVSSVALVTRTTTGSDGTVKNETKKPRTSLHLRLGGAELSASERLTSLGEPQAAVMFQIDRVMVSVGAKEVTYFDADIGSIVGSTASGKVEYLASLIHRTGSLATELGHLLGETTSRHKDRVKVFAYRLLKAGEKTYDPSFLIRPSAILRSASEHLRTSDSWKLMMRLRQIWATLPPEVATRLIADCWEKSPIVPPNADHMVVAAFQKWRSWDLENPAKSVLLHNIFGPLVDMLQQEEEEYPTLGACRLGEMYFILDPGPKQNKVGLADLNARMEQKKAGSESGLPETSDPDGMITVLSIDCSDAALHLNWELCELADDILRLYNRTQSQSPEPPKSIQESIPNPTKAKQARPAIHVVFELLSGSIELESINLRAKTLSDGMKASALIYGGGEVPRFTNFVLHCDSVTSRLHSHSQLLGLYRLRKPSVLFCHELEETDNTSVHTIKATASSQGLTLEVKQDAIALMEVVDLLVRDEVAQIYRIKKQLPTSPAPRTSVKIAERLSSFRVNIAMFLDGYSITLPLVQSLTYKISGVVARAACAANFGKEVIFDFDIKENSHDMQIDVKNEPRSISLLQIPPTNGRITSQTHHSEHVVTVLSSVEVIKLDASAVYSLLTALNRPQISSAIDEVQQQSMLIREHLSDIFGSEEPAPPKEPSSLSLMLVYNVHLTLAGLQVFAQTSLKSRSEPLAQVLFSLDKIYLQASNRHETHGPTSRYPELHFNLRKIGLDIRRGRQGDMRSCGNLAAGVTVSASSIKGDDGVIDWSFNCRSDGFELNLSPETISTVVDVLGYLGEKIKDLDTSRELEYLRKLRQTKPRITLNDRDEPADDTDILDSVLSSVIYHFELRNVRVCWNVADDMEDQSGDKEDLMLFVKLIEFGTRTKKSARLTIEDFQLQMVPPGQDRNMRSRHSALLPEVIFNVAYVSTPDARRMAFQAVGESVDIRLTSAFIVPAANLVKSIAQSAKNARLASAQWNTGIPLRKKADDTPVLDRQASSNIFGKRRVENLLIDADFAGAVVHVSGKRSGNDMLRTSKYGRLSLAGKYGQFNADDSGSGAVLRSPGLAWKAEYRDNGREDPTLYGEIKIDASSNILYPSVVPLVMDIISSVKEVVSNTDEAEPALAPAPGEPSKMKPEKSTEEDNILTTDPSAVLGRIKLNLGLRIRRQEFSLSCQPIARVAATACFDNIYFTINTVTSQDQGNFFAISGEFTKPQASVQHVYSRESTGSFEIDAINLSFMNSKHVSGTSGVSAILNVSPVKMSINAKQVQDFLLFREIWYPKELRQASSVPVAKLSTETSQGHLVQRYQQVAATAAFPWTATISIAALDVNVDLGQAIGKSVFAITDFWVSSKKTSDWEQNLCLGFGKIGVDCTGRLSGFVALQDFKLRTSIQWPKREEALNDTPRIQASLSFNAFRLKAAFDYQAFLVADITSLEFLMYNVRDSLDGSADRLVAIFDGEAVQVFGTTTSTAQAIALYQALQKLFQERKENFQSSLQEIEKFMRRKSGSSRNVSQSAKLAPKLPQDDTLARSPISLDTDVVVTLKKLNLGVFPSTFSDHQVFKMEALNAYARFAASIENRRVHSILRMTLGQLRIGLAGVRNAEAPKTLSEISVEDVVQRATGSRGGTILKVPKVAAVMETWQKPNSNHIEYIFKSAFEGKVEVGWNYSRISYIRGMWANHSKSLEQVWGRELPLTAVKITGVPQTEAEQKDGEQQKITAEVNVPQSRYEYRALEPPIIETPQLRDMGEATPPLEWIGLHREKLPNLTHQIVIVSLLELAGEVEDAYSSILGSS